MTVKSNDFTHTSVYQQYLQIAQDSGMYVQLGIVNMDGCTIEWLVETPPDEEGTGERTLVSASLHGTQLEFSCECDEYNARGWCAHRATVVSAFNSEA